jgi:methionyl-tRNA formyltransferase
MLPARGCLNIHASPAAALARRAPIHRAIEAGDTETGVTIMQMDAGLDTGDMLLVCRQLAAGGHSADCRQRAGVGGAGDRVLRQSALCGV